MFPSFFDIASDTSEFTDKEVLLSLSLHTHTVKIFKCKKKKMIPIYEDKNSVASYILPNVRLGSHTAENKCTK